MRVFVMPELPRPLSIVCHDAGGANQIHAMVGAGDFGPDVLLLEGPARQIWKNSLGSFRRADHLEDALRGIRTLVTGTGWGAHLEHHARELARKRGIFSVAVLDHWINYASRFERDGHEVLPDLLWVVDEHARRIAAKTFPGTPIEMRPDRYAEQQLGEIQALSPRTPNDFLYLLEPVRSTWDRDKGGEFQALDFFLENLPALALPDDTRIFLRSHPSDPPRKYEKYLSAKQPHVLREDQRTLAQALSASRWVAGCQTYAMTLALKAGRRVICSLPPWAPPCALPHDGILHLKELAPR
jgi:hypothetical protein